MNLTILSLSISSIYSISPLFYGNKNNFHKFSFHNYFSPTIFLNPETLFIEKTIFSHGIGSILHSNSNVQLLKDSKVEFIGKEFVDTNLNGLNPPNEKSLIVIRDCTFNNIRYANLDDGKNSNENKIDNYMIKVLSNCTFYMTNCLFDSCYFNKSALFLNSRATTISHICCNNIHGGQEGDALFLRSNTPGGSFFKFFYSTFFGNYQYFPTNGILYMAGTCALRYQCNNATNFILSNENNRYIARIEATACLTMLMNTFYHCDSQYVLWINIHDGNKEGRYNHYCGLTNFYDNKQQSAIIYLDLQSETRITIDECYFANTNVENRGEKIINNNGNANVYISNCVFKSYLSNVDLQKTELFNIRDNVWDLQTMTLAHYTVMNKCDAIHVIDAFGCQNDTCPDSKGCKTFGFVDDDVKYTEIFHPDINTATPTPTEVFTGSNSFTYSHIFTSSNRFTDSKKFTKSNDFTSTRTFTASNHFSKSGHFTKSDIFTKSGLFTKSHSFTRSHIFSASNKFSSSHSFTKSSSFTGSHSFTLSSDFTKSGSFSFSCEFSLSSFFSETGSFSETTKFTFSSYFTESGKFTLTKQFSNSEKFSKSLLFSASKVFTESRHFDASGTFTPSNSFTASDTFNASSLFTNSLFFTNSGHFSKTFEFSCTTKFTQTTEFTNSFHFTGSSFFTNSKEFTPSNHFDATGTFTASDHFTSSDHFTASNNFRPSNIFSSSNGFTQSSTFSQSKVFTSSKTYKNSVVIIINQNKGSNKWKVIGGAAGALLSAALVGIIVFMIIFFRHRKHEQGSDMFEELNTIDDPHSSITYNNVLNGLDMEDDPFQDDFDDFHDGNYHHFD